MRASTIGVQDSEVPHSKVLKTLQQEQDHSYH